MAGICRMCVHTILDTTSAILRTYHEPGEYHDCLHPHISINALFQECGDVKQAKVDELSLKMCFKVLNWKTDKKLLLEGAAASGIAAHYASQ